MAAIHKEFYVLNSRNIDPDNPDSTDIQVKLPIDWNKGYDSLYISSLSIPKTYYSLPADAVLVLQEDAKSVNITVSKGNYNIRSLATELAADLTANSPNTLTYTVGFPNSFIERDTAKYTITKTNGGILATISTDDVYLANMLGIRRSSSYEFNDNFESPNVLNFQAYDELLIKSNIVKNNSKLVQEVYTAGNPYNSSIIWNCPDIEAFSKEIHPTDTNMYSFQLMTIDGDLLNLNGSSWSIVLVIYKSDKTNQLIRDYIRYRTITHTQTP